MKDAICRALSEALLCPIYDGCAPQGLESPSCVVLPPEFSLLRRTETSALLDATVTVCARGLEEKTPLILHTLACVPSGQGAYRGEKMKTETADGVVTVTAHYRVRAAFEAGEEEAPVMERLELKQEEKDE